MDSLIICIDLILIRVMGWGHYQLSMGEGRCILERSTVYYRTSYRVMGAPQSLNQHIKHIFTGVPGKPMHAQREHTNSAV